MKDLLQATITLASGASASRAVGILSIPILTRLFTPEDFGVFSLYMSVLLILVPLSTLRYLTAIPLPRQDRTAFAILALCVGLAASFAMLLMVVVLTIGAPILGYLSMNVLVPYALLIPAGVLLASLFEIFTMWATRHRNYSIIAKTQVWQASLSEGLKILLGVAGVGATGLLIGHTFGYGGGLRVLVSRSWSDFRSMAPRLSWGHISLVARRFSGFPITRIPAQLLLALAVQAPLLLTAAHYDISTTGQMAVAIMAVTLPITVVGQAASRAFYAEAARGGGVRADWIMDALRRVMFSLGIVSLPIAAILFVFAESAAALILGQDWAQAGRFSSLLALALMPQLVATTMHRTLDLLEAHLLVIGFNLTRLFLVYVAFTGGAWLGLPPEQTVLNYSVLLAVHHSLEITLIYLALRHKKKEPA